jgi:hypothetical protein
MKKIILAVLATVFVSAQAYAFDGTISFSGTMTQKGSFSMVTTNHFNADWQTSLVPNTGAYAGVPPMTSVTLFDFSFSGNNTGTPTILSGGSPQWSFTYLGVEYSFNLEALDSANTTFIPGVGRSIAETGHGTAFITGQGSAAAIWSLSGVIGQGFTFGVQTLAAGNAPDGGSAVALLGIALAGIEGVRRVIRARKA